MAESYPTLLAGQRITASLLSSMLPQVARKTSDTSRNSTTTRTLDPHLQFTADANSIWVFEGWVAYDSDNAADIILGFDTPSGTLGTWAGFGTGTTIYTGGGASNTTQTNTVTTFGYMLRVEYTAIGSPRTFGGLGVGNPETVYLRGTVRVGSTGGTWGLSWYQAASNAINTTIFTDSWLKAQRIG